jgi:signal recognition particle receptor subunit beta
MGRKKNKQETATTTTTSTSDTSDDEDNKNRGTPPATSQQQQQQQQQRLLQTTLRESIAPYLPPPVLKAIKEIDPQLEPYVGPEGCITIVGSLLLAYALYQLVRSIFGSSSSSSSLGGGKNKAIQEDYRDQDILPVSNEKSRPFDGTIVLCGPSLTGKTSLFYRLIQQEQQQKWKTVRSIKSNTGFLEHNRKVLRVLDTPGHWGPEKLIRAVPLQDIDRLLVVVDSTQPVAPAADYLYAILKQQKSKSKSNNTSVLISCHKSDHPKAKNARRIKLQLRSELIRLSKLDNVDDENDNYWEENLNAIPLCSSNVDKLNAVREFCETGAIPLPSTTTKR